MFEIAAQAALTGHPVTEALDAVQQAISDIEDSPTWGLQSDELARLVAMQEALGARLAALGLGLVREADRRELGSAVGATSTADWLRDRLCLDHGAAKGRIDLAALLDVDAAMLDAAGRAHDTAWLDGSGAPQHTGYPDPVTNGASQSDDAGASATRAAGNAGPGASAVHGAPGADGAPGAAAVGSVRRTGLGIDVTAVSELAAAARRHLPCTAWALRAGRISVEHAQVVRRAMKRLPTGLDSVVWAECEAFLAVHASRHSPRNLARLGSHLATSVAGAHELRRQQEREAEWTSDDQTAATSTDDGPSDASNDGGNDTAGEADGDGGPGVCADDPPALDNDRFEERAEASTMFGFVDNGDGTVRPYGSFSEEAADLITSALSPLAAPRPAADGTPDPRGYATRMGEALIELCRRAMDAGDLLPGARGARPHVTITASLSTLRRESGSPKAATMWGTPITSEGLRRLACDADVSRVLTDHAGVPLDVGRAYRTVTPAQWVALVARDKGCAFPGCSRPAAWTQAHHIKHWADGGATDLSNLVLLCGHHHRSVHHRGWTVRIGADGHPEFLPPPWIDPARKPRRNTYHRVVDAVSRHPAAQDGAGRPSSGAGPHSAESGTETGTGTGPPGDDVPPDEPDRPHIADAVAAAREADAGTHPESGPTGTPADHPGHPDHSGHPHHPDHPGHTGHPDHPGHKRRKAA